MSQPVFLCAAPRSINVRCGHSAGWQPAFQTWRLQVLEWKPAAVRSSATNEAKHSPDRGLATYAIAWIPEALRSRTVA